MQKRKLAAIMFTDIQGYTAIMQQSEEEALQLRDKHRAVFQKVTEEYNGEILQYYGDGTLSVFDSAVDAVKCGIDIQKSMREEPQVPVRIGIHSGDIIFTDDDIIGDGVNVASRIESLAVVGSVFISDKVYDEVKNSAYIETQFLKTFKLKNVERPVDVYVITNPGMVIPDVSEITGKIEREEGGLASWRRILVPSIITLLAVALISFWIGSFWNGTAENIPAKKVAIVPFDIQSTEEDDEYFKSGMTDGLINELSKVDALTVISQASTQVLTAGFSSGSSFMLKEIGDIDYFVNGSVDRNDNQLQIDLMLRESPDADPIWKNSYSKDIAEIRPLWAEASADISRQMGVTIRDEDASLWANLRPVNPETYELYLKGVHYMNKSTPADWQRGLVYFEEARDKNPADAYAYAGLAEAYVRLGHGPAPPPDVFPKALAAAERAIKLDSTLAQGWAALSHYHTYFGMDWELAEYAFNRANDLNPNLADNHYHRAWYLALFGRMNEAIEEHKRAQELDPFTPLNTGWLGELYRWVGLYEEGLAEAEKASQMENDYALSMFIKGRIYLDQGKQEEGLDLLRQASDIFRGWKYIGYGPGLIQAGRIEEGRAVAEELEGLPLNGYHALCLGIMYSELGDMDKAFEYFNYEQRHGWFPWIRVMFTSEKIRNDPRFLELIRGMNLPDPAPLAYNPEA